jgi:hypothetical protein
LTQIASYLNVSLETLSRIRGKKWLFDFTSNDLIGGLLTFASLLIQQR